MRLDPKKVRFVLPTLHLGLSSSALRFVGHENTVQLSETALVVEGNLLKVGLLGIEVLFRRALAEWSSVTIPYSRITRARYVRVPFLRAIAIVLLLLSFAGAALAMAEFPELGLLLGVGLGLLNGFLVIRIPARYVITFRGADGRPVVFMFRITSRKLRREFDRKLEEYRAAARRFESAGVRRPQRGRVPRRDRRAALLAGLFLLLTVGLGVLAYLIVLPLLGGLGSDRPRGSQPQIGGMRAPAPKAGGREMIPPPRPVGEIPPPRAVGEIPPPRPRK
jgi:hypothetical protein